LSTVVYRGREGGLEPWTGERRQSFPLFIDVPGKGHPVKTPNNKDTKEINSNYLLIDLVIH
jgi:hypothetical protein